VTDPVTYNASGLVIAGGRYRVEDRGIVDSPA
jgi:hypothetical protein